MSSRSCHFFISVILLFLPFWANSQEKNEVKLISYREEGRILLRWAPTNSSDWLAWNKSGYSLIRYTIIRDSTRIYPPEQDDLGNLFKPVDLTEWERVAIDDKYAAIAAQAIYGDSFMTVVDRDEANVVEMIQLAKEQDLRFSFALLSADQSFDVARLSGLGYEDTNVEENEYYLYKLFGNGGVIASDTAYSYVTPYDSAALPAILELKANFGNQNVSLTWRKDYYENTYNSYIVERSTDGKEFLPLSDLPSITASPDKEVANKWMLKTDTLAGNGIRYYYRVRGKTPFGILGPPSRTVSGVGKEDFTLSIGITDAVETKEGVTIKWTVEGSAINQMEQIFIERSDNATDYQQLDTLSSSAREYLDGQSNGANYYKVIAVNGFGDKLSSLPYFVQTEDSIPPAVPDGLIGFADTLGTVKISWQTNTESDIAGYRVFRSRVRDAEYRQVTVEANVDTIFSDRVDLETLSRNIYYKVLAVDFRGNNSNMSEAMLIKLPDLIRPVPPRITGYKLVGDGVKINWQNSSSTDLAFTKLFRSINDTLILLKKMDESVEISTYTDTVYTNGIASYYLTATDDSGNESVKSNIIQLKIKNKKNSPPVNLSAKADRVGKVINLSWSTTNQNQEIRLYKAKGDEPISLYKVFGTDEQEFKDNVLEVNETYHYLLQIIDMDSGTTKFSKQVKIVY